MRRLGVQAAHGINTSLRTTGVTMKRSWTMTAVLALLAAGAMLFAGCEDKDHNTRDIAGTGNSVVKGNIVEFGVDAPAAAVAGARVYLKGTDIEAEVGEDGTFLFTNVPAGTYEVVFEYGGFVGVLEITVEDGMEVEIRDVTVYEDGTVDATIIIHRGGGTVNVAGVWDFTWQGPGAEIEVAPTALVDYPDMVMTLQQNGHALTGTLLEGGMTVIEPPTLTLEAAVRSLGYDLTGSIDNRNLNLTGTYMAVTVNGVGPLNLVGQVNSAGDYMSGTWSQLEQSGTWTAVPAGD